MLAVIVILAILALIATPVVLGIINDTRGNAKLRSAEMYLNAVDQAILNKNINTSGGSIPKECQVVAKGNLECDGTQITVEVDGEVPDSGTIKYEDASITDISLVYDTETIVMNEKGSLVYQ